MGSKTEAAKKITIDMLIKELKELIKHPKKLIPTFVLAGLWLLLPILSVVGVNIPVFRFLYTLTYANGGMFGGFFGMIGGIFGKAVFATVVNVFVLAVCEKKNPFKGVKTVALSAVNGGMNAISPLLIGGGAGILLYFFFNVTSSLQNCAISIACALAGLKALAGQNGLVFSGVFFILKRVSKGKAPSKMTVSRVLTGLCAGFAVSFPLTFARLPLLIFILGVVLTVAGAVIPRLGVKKAATAAVALIFSLTLFGTGVSAAANSLPKGFIAPESIEGFTLTNNVSGLSKYSRFYLEPAYITSGYRNSILDGPFYFSGMLTTDPVEISGEAKILDRASSTDSYHFTGSYSASSTGFKGDLIDYSDYEYEISYEVDCTLNNIRFDYNRVIADFEAEESVTYTTDQPDSESGKMSNAISGTSDRDDCNWVTKNGEHFLVLYSPQHTENVPYSTLGIWFRLSGLYEAEGAFAEEQEESEESEDDDYVPYRGRLSYTNGRVNKYGQPFPDLMDFDEDGEITWLDMDIQRELSHDPDWLDRPVSKATGVFLAILTGLLGAAGGAVGGIAGGMAGATAGAVAQTVGEAVSEAASGVLRGADDPEDLGPYISRDADGDLNVNDPATGEKRLYKSNGDGTYTNPLTGATYTESELKDSLESRSENAELLREDANTAGTAVKEQREKSGELSELTKQLEKERAEELAKDEREHAHDVYVEKMRIHYGTTNDDTIREKIAEKQGQAEIEGYEQMELEKEYYESQKYVENVKKGADIAIDVLAEVEPTGVGKVIKDGYTVGSAAASNFGEVMAHDKSVGGAITQTLVDSAVGLAKNHAGDINITGTAGYAEKAVANITGDGIQAMSNEYVKSGSVDKALKAGSEAAKQGAKNFAVDSTFDALGAKFGSESGKGIGKVMGSEVTKKTATEGAKAFGSDVVKDVLSPDDPDDVAAEKAMSAREKAEEDVNRDAVKKFKEAQSDWRDRKDD